MKKNKFVLDANRIIGLVIFCLVILNFISIATINKAEARERERVNISYYNDEGFYILDESDLLTGGYAYDLQAALNRYLNWDVHYFYGTWIESLENVKNGKTDIIFGAVKTPAREKEYIFNTEPIATVSNYVTGRSDEPFLENDYTKLEGKRIGLVNGSASSKDIRDFLNKKNIKATYVTVAGYKKLNQLLASNKIDYFITDTGKVDGKEKLLQKFTTKALYIMATKDKKYLMDEFDSAIKKMRTRNPGLMKKILSKTYKNKVVNISSLINADEREFLKTVKELKCGVLENSSPYYEINKNGKVEGVIKVVVDKIDEATNLKIKLIPFKSSDELITALKKGEINMLGKVSSDYYNSQIYNYNLSKSYLASEVIILKSKTENTTKELKNVYAIEEKNFGYENELKASMPNIIFKKYKTAQGCIDALNDGEVGAAIIYDFNTKVYKSELEDTDTLISYLANGVYLSHCFAFSDRVDVRCLEIVDKVINNLDSTDIKFAIINSVKDPYNESMVEIFVNKYKFQLLASMVGLFFLIFLYTKTRRQNEALSRANKKANAATVAKTDFLANMSHELRTPLNGVIGLNYLLKANLDNKEVASDYADKIDQSSKMLLSIINDILDMSVIESGKLKLANKEFNVKELIYSVTNLYYIQCREKGINYELNISAMEYETLIGDSYRIRQIVLNLLSNAVKFTEKGHRINVKFSERKIDNKTLVLYIEVVDTGCGMSKDLQKRLFKEFEQEDATTVRAHGGSGLGLAITKRLLDLMEGDVKVTSKLGEGTKFSVEIPLKVVEQSELKTKLDTIVLDALIVDNNLESCKSVTTAIKSWNMKADYALQTEEALKMIKKRIEEKNAYNFYIIDIAMPEISGVEFVKKIKKIINSETAIIMISSYDITELKGESSGDCSEYFIRKPIFPSEIINSLVTRLDSKKSLKNKFTNLNSILFKKTNILLVEDNKINQLVAKRILEKAGANVYVATNGKDAIKLVKKKDIVYDIVFMDIQMPIMDGHEATKLIRAIGTDYTNELPIYAMTANSFQSDIEKSFACGMNGHISKPINPDEIIELLEKVVQAKKD